MVADTQKAQDFLARVNYYRFRGYLLNYFDLPKGKPWNFRAGSKFDSAEQLYCFDEELRRVLFASISDIEILVRSRLDSCVGAIAKNGFWYLEDKYYNKFPQNSISKLNSEFLRSREEFAKHFHENYYNEISGVSKGMPPFWVLSELSTFGQLIEFLVQLKPSAAAFNHVSQVPNSTPLDKMAQNLGAASFKQLVSWLTVIRAVRNLCAHHSRLWNRNLAAPDGVQNYLSVPSVATGNRHPNNTLHAALACMRIIERKALGSNKMFEGLRCLFYKYPEADSLKNGMGVPNGWEACNIWKP